jgi:enoyl-CoA hydratase
VNFLDQATDELLIESPSAGVVIARINRPQARNALNLSLRNSLAGFFRSASEDSDVRCIVLAGCAKAFCAGADLREYVDASAIEIMQRNMHLSWNAIAQCPIPVVAAVRGYALGGGCELAMHADIIIAGETAVFGQPEVKVGLMPGGGATQRLPRAIGKARAMDMLLTGKTISAPEAFAAGLISRVVADEDVESEANRVAAEIAQLPALAIRLVKEAVLISMNSPLETGLKCERRAFQLLFSSDDKKEGIQAFLDKRQPIFRGM